jgi:aldehyde dehydrogenase (NAD+)
MPELGLDDGGAVVATTISGALTPTETASRFLARSPLGLFIDGAFCEAAGGGVGDVMNPADGSVLAQVAYGDDTDVDAAVRAAHRASVTWSAMPAIERAVRLHRLADLIEAEAETIAQLEALDVGKPIGDAEGFDVPFGVEGLRYFADLSARVSFDEPLAIKNIEARSHFAPHGVCGFIYPWNFPFLILMWGLGPALAAGNTVVVKPSEVTPLTTLFVGELMQRLDFPPGVVNVVTGTGPEAGAPIAEHPLVRHVSFTGSTRVGQQIGAATGRRPIPSKLELGGKGAALLFDDIDVGAAAAALAGAITLNAGQVCCTATRWIVHERIYDEFVSEATRVLAQTKLGPGMDRSSQMGPVVSQAQRDRVLDYFEKGQAEGAVPLLDPTTRTPKGSEGGFFVAPHLLAGSADNVCFKEEVFGPTAFLTRFKDEDEAVASVNSIDYGLANSVWSADLSRASRVAERMISGSSWVNAHNVFAYGLPYGGVNLSGGGGGVNSPSTFYDYLRHQTIARPL